MYFHKVCWNEHGGLESLKTELVITVKLIKIQWIIFLSFISWHEAYEARYVTFTAKCHFLKSLPTETLPHTPTKNSTAYN